MSGIFFNAVVHVVIIFGLDMLVMNPRMGRALEGFQHKVHRRITGRKPHRFLERSWEHPLLETEIQEAGFEDVEAYVLRRQNMFTQYIVMRTIVDLCEETLQMPVTWVA